MGQFAKRVVQRRCWKFGVEFGEGVSKACFQDYLVIVRTFRSGCAGVNVGSMYDPPSKSFEPVLSGGFYRGFVDGVILAN